MSEQQRNYGIDLLRIISMIMIVTLHVLGHGGVLKRVEAFTIRGEIVWGLEIFCYAAVNIYALISGYVGYKSKQKYANIFILWLETVLYNLLFLTIGFVFAWERPANIWKVFKCFFPILNVNYWYFSAYFCLFFFMPILQFVLKKAPRNLLKITILSLLFFLSVVPMIESIPAYYTYGGYSFFWLSLLYLIGGYIAEYNPFEKISIAMSWLIYLFCVLLTMASRFLIYYEL